MSVIDDSRAATEAFRYLDLAQEHLRQLLPHWPAVRPGDIKNQDEVAAAIDAVAEAAERLLMMFTGAQPAPSTDDDGE
jgi:hypothetical protein